MEKEKTCYMFECDKYPQCDLAAGNCCAIEVEEYEKRITVEECGESLEYQMFRKKCRTFFNPEDLK